jgi:hypothetical protein
MVMPKEVLTVDVEPPVDVAVVVVDLVSQLQVLHT